MSLKDQDCADLILNICEKVKISLQDGGEDPVQIFKKANENLKKWQEIAKEKSAWLIKD